ncbi:hypothetical protein K445DRAFT_8389 [Daldinia sp. EC12]|nr:hypothetical protein K445DRAFT_8389 [Daldinia sp. EC12]
MPRPNTPLPSIPAPRTPSRTPRRKTPGRGARDPVRLRPISARPTPKATASSLPSTSGLHTVETLLGPAYLPPFPSKHPRPSDDDTPDDPYVILESPTKRRRGDEIDPARQRAYIQTLMESLDADYEEKVFESRAKSFIKPVSSRRKAQCISNF